MIVGTGIDIIEVERIQSAMERPGFLEKLFTDSERAYIDSKHRDPKTVAGMFAAKEAVVKALGTGFGAVGFHDVEITHDALFKPGVTLCGGALERMAVISGRGAHISISHIKALAAAQAIIED